ncbi:hypothetical protein [Cellulomonas sp. KRMCY2]|uniref:hypothetical protein n=1 Tax=Cellulomonas sp. KRMCY2 TaxID=1304865 RepID=UPI0004AD42E9|nr:hypothetical protein [Cellulomonas sp. KRMCY2]
MTFDTVRLDTQRLDTQPFDPVRLDTQPFGRPADDQVALLLGGVRLGRTGAADPRSRAMTEHLAEHIDRVGHRPRGTTGLVEALGRADLTGYGGAHVPTATKWRSALAAGRPLVVVANGAESEPLSAKDATLLRQRPHLVLDGLALAAEALGARRAVLWLHAGDTGARAAVELALAERLTAGAPDPRMEVVVGPDHYLSGESSAIARALAGGPALPTARRPAALPPVPRALWCTTSRRWPGWP